MNTLLKILWVFSLLTNINFLAKAQRTHATITVSENVFYDATEIWEFGMANLKVVSLEFSINGIRIGTIYRSDLIEPGNYQISNEIDLTAALNPVSIKVVYSHQERNIFGITHSYPSLSKYFDIGDMELDRNISETRTFNAFDDLDETIVVTWSFNYNIQISPFKPAINPNAIQCYNTSSYINPVPMAPVFYVNTDVLYEWQYGFMSKEWIENYEFNIFKENITNSLYERCPGNTGNFSCDKVITAVYNTDYSFMIPYNYLYDDLTESNKYEISTLILNGILSQQYSFLTDDEKSFLSNYFYESVLNQGYWGSPYYEFSSIKNWTTSATYTAFADSLKFVPADIVPLSPDFVIIYFRVRAYAPDIGKYGPFSEPKSITIKPRAPSFNAGSISSCINRGTGEIKLSDINGEVTGSEYICNVTRSGEEAGPGIFFTGTSFSIGGIKDGEYFVDLYYTDPEITGCSVAQKVNVGLKEELSYTFSKKDASCPETADGEISVNISSFVDNYEFKINERSFKNTDGIFGNLDNGSYTLEVTDFCYTGEYRKVTNIIVNEPIPVVIESITKSDPTCLATPNGSVSITVNGGKNIYDFQILEQDNLITEYLGQASGWSYNLLPGGSYILKARSEGCAWKSSDPQILNHVQPVSFTYTSTDVVCFGDNSGRISINASGGKGPYMYSINTQVYTTNSAFESLIKGSYLINVHTSDLSCNDFASKEITVNSAPKIEIGLSASDATCFEKDDGKITASVLGGTGSIRYSWDYFDNDAWYPTGINLSSVSGLIAGTYRVNVNDSKNCRAANEIVIKEPPQLKVKSAVPKDVICYGNLGSIEIQASGGVGEYQYSCFGDVGSEYHSLTNVINLPASDYTVKVKDANGCEAIYGNEFEDFLVPVTGPESPLDFVIVKSDFNGFNVPCHADATGSITIEASGGNGSGFDGYFYSFSGAPDQTVKIFTNISAGSYNVKLTDGRGCSVQKSMELKEPDALELNLLNVEPVRCFGLASGEISVMASGGIQNTYSFKLNGDKMISSGQFKNLYTNTYEVEVADMNGCRKNLNVVVPSLNPPIITSLLPEDERCFGGVNGKIKTIVTGGAGGFALQWGKKIDETWQLINVISADLENLLPGNYRVKITDSENCVAFDSAEVKEPSLLEINNVSVKDAVCFGDNGSMEVLTKGGVGGYTYVFSEAGGLVYESRVPGINLPAGNYIIKTRDTNGCEAVYGAQEPEIQSISGPSVPLEFSGIISDFNGYSVSCKGESDGSIIIEASGGNGTGYDGYLYSLSDLPDQPNKVYNGLRAGSYDIKVTDGRGCSLKKSLRLTEPEEIQMKLGYIDPVKCFGASTGEISVITSGGVADTYSYKIGGKEMLSSGIFKNLVADTYLIEVSDSNRCSKSVSVKVEHKNPQIQTLLIPKDANCFGESNGSITAEVAGGSGGFIYQLEKKINEDWLNAGEMDDMQDLGSGFYRVKVTDSDNCFSYDSAQIKEPLLLKFSNVKIKDAICYSDSGSIGIEIEGGTPEYKFHYFNGTGYSEYSQGSPLPAGTYKLKVTDSHGCVTEKSETVTITQPIVKLDLTYLLKDYNGYNVSCHGNNDGQITVIPSGGNGKGYSGYTYRLSDRYNQSDSVFKSLAAGEYDLTLTDSRGCELNRKVRLSESISEMSLRPSSIKRPVCINTSDGEISLAASGGAEPYLYSSDGNNFVASGEFKKLSVNPYSFIVKDANGCSETFDTTLINVIPEMHITGNITDVKCFGENSGEINISIKGGAKPYLYKWKDSPSVTSRSGNQYRGSYFVSVTDSGGCIAEKMFQIREPDFPLTLKANSGPACVSLKNGYISATAAGGTPPYMFAVGTSSFSTTPSFNVAAGKHALHVKDHNNCLSEIMVEVGERNKMPLLNFMLATSRYELDTLVIIDVSVPVPDKVAWQFSPEAQVIDTGLLNARIKYNQSGLYPVKMTGYFGSCNYSIEKLLNIAPFDPLVTGDDKNLKGIKSIRISPNPSDGQFELKIELYTKQQITLKVYDYYSRMIFNEKLPENIAFLEEFNLAETKPGTYVLWVIAENDARPVVFVISK